MNNFFFCYSKSLADYLISNNFEPITVAMNPKNNKLFSLFIRNDSFNQMLTEYNQYKILK